MKIGSRDSASVAVSTARQERIQGARLDGVNYGKSKSVQRARDEITYMGFGEIFVDMSQGGGKRAYLERLADVLLLEKAANWQQDGSDRVLCEQMRKLDRREVQARFLEMLSPQQRQAILAKPEEAEDGIRFSPDTRTELDNLLSITVSREEGKKLLASGDLAEAWQTARTHELEAINSKTEAEAMRSNGVHPLAAKAWMKAAEHYSASGRSSEAAEACEQAASDLTADSQAPTNDRQRLAAAEALGAAAEYWHDAGRHEKSAASRHEQAAFFTKLGMDDEAAECTKMEGQQRDLQRRNFPASELPREILHEIASRVTDSASLQAFALVNARWNSVVTPGQNDARAVAKTASDQVVDHGLEELTVAIAAIKQLPPAHQLGPLLQLADKLIIKNPSHRAGCTLDTPGENLLVFRAIHRAASNLAPGDKRKLYARLSTFTPDIPTKERNSAWRACFNKIREINAAEPRDMGASVVQLATSFPPELINAASPEFSSFRSMIDEMKDGDPQKKLAQTALGRALYTEQGQRYFSEEDSFNGLF